MDRHFRLIKTGPGLFFEFVRPGFMLLIGRPSH